MMPLMMCEAEHDRYIDHTLLVTVLSYLTKTYDESC